MKAYIANGDNTLGLIDNAKLENGKTINLRISKVMPTMDDVSVYEGKLDLKYPIIPCGIATAIVGEDYPEYGIKRGERVIINPFVLDNLVQEESEKLNKKQYGFDVDGFLRDFVTLPLDNLVLFPEGVKEEDAIFSYALSTAILALNAIKIKEGKSVVLLGDNVLNLILVQLLKYYKMVPIFISGRKKHRDLAKEMGCYFSIDERKENVAKKMFEITGGRYADGAIFSHNVGPSANLIPLITTSGAKCIIADFSYRSPVKMNLEVSSFLRKSLVLQGIGYAEKEFNTAVNMVALDELDLASIIDHEVTFASAPKLFGEMAANPKKYVCPIIKI